MPTALTTPESAADPELFFALVGPAGVDIEAVVTALDAELGAVGYSLNRGTKLAELLHALKPYEHLAVPHTFEDERIVKHMDAGDQLRGELDHGAALAALAVNSVRVLRGELPRPRSAYLFRSLKHPAEVDLLRAVYGPSLVVISVYEPEEARLTRLTQRLRRSGRAEDEAETRARALMDRDQQGGDTNKLGQNVRDTFPKADFFLDGSADVRQQLARLMELLFGHPFRSPTRDEYGMAVAHTAARRSADLSRQVGAAIADLTGEVIAAGCNEVPKPGGGVYWDGDNPDLRDYKQGTDSNAIIGREVLTEVFEILKAQGWLDAAHASRSADELVREGVDKQTFKHARVASLIEFGRVVHAEMNAVTFAAQRGISVGGARLYCTTLPCHGCARHLLGAGLAEVVYIEPYPKSLAAELYPRAIALGAPAEAASATRLVFRPFTGVAPSRYQEFFDYGRRKDPLGYAQSWDPKTARCRVRKIGNPHLLVEQDLCATLTTILAERGWT